MMTEMSSKLDTMYTERMRKQSAISFEMCKKL